jgi:multidrug resistance efflux pump
VRVLGEDGQEKMETINDMLMSQNGPVPVNDMSLGKYEVRVAVGPNYSSKREETRAGMEEFFRAYPQAAPLLGDLYAKTLEWQDADRAAKRLRKMLPPGVAEEDQDEEMTPEQMQAKQAQAMQAQQQMQMQQQAMEIERRKAEAEATEAEADAVKAQAEAQKAQIEVAALNGDIKALVEGSVEQAVAAVMTRPSMI